MKSYKNALVLVIFMTLLLVAALVAFIYGIIVTADQL